MNIIRIIMIIFLIAGLMTLALGVFGQVNTGYFADVQSYLAAIRNESSGEQRERIEELMTLLSTAEQKIRANSENVMVLGLAIAALGFVGACIRVRAEKEKTEEGVQQPV